MAVTSETTVQQLRPESGPALQDDVLLDCFLVVARLHQRPLSRDAVLAGLPRDRPVMTPELFVRAADQQDFSARVLRRSLKKISSLVLPAVLLLEDGNACVLTRLERRGDAEVIFPESGMGVTAVPVAELARRYTGYAVFMQPRPREDARMGASAPSGGGSLWFWRVMWRFRGYYAEAALAAFTVNLLALAMALFIMNVYDRVVPNNALETLTVLALGVTIAVAFEFVAKTLRGYFLDVAGRKADVLLAGTLFHQAMGLRMEVRPPSAGSFASQLREFESLRDFFSSATLATLTDLPFIALFVWVISIIGGPLFLAPLAGIPLVLLAALVAQLPLSILTRKHMRESNLKHGLLVEAIEGAETLKTLGAEGVVQGRWEDYTAITGRSAVAARMVSAAVVNFTQLVSQGVTIGVVVWGVHLIAAGELTTGALIACVILCGRGLAPLAQVAGLLARYQHSRAAYHMLDGLMRQPLERPRHARFVHRPRIAGALELQGVEFCYPGQTQQALRGVSLRIEAGERVAILGAVGSGKSTLLKLMLKLYAPTAGSVLLDGVDLSQYDPAELRRQVGYVSQEVRLFYGSLRDNIALGADFVEDRDVIEAARVAGLESMVARHPEGFDLTIQEGGAGLSGGQKGAVGIARLLVRRPRVLVMDEPTASMDHSMEQAFISRIRPLLSGRTLVLVTHKPTLLNLVDRVVVLDGGRVVADGPRDKVMEALTVRVSPSGEAAPFRSGSGRADPTGRAPDGAVTARTGGSDVTEHE